MELWITVGNGPNFLELHSRAARNFSLGWDAHHLYVGAPVGVFPSGITRLGFPPAPVSTTKGAWAAIFPQPGSPRFGQGDGRFSGGDHQSALHECAAWRRDLPAVGKPA